MIWFKTRKKFLVLSLPITIWVLVQLSIGGLLLHIHGAYGTNGEKSDHSLQKRSTWTRRHGESDFDYILDDPFVDRPYYDLKSNLQNGNAYRVTDPEPVDDEQQHDHNDQKYGSGHTDIIENTSADNLSVVYIGCVHAWYGFIRDQFSIVKFDMNMDYKTCAAYCQVKDEKYCSNA